MNAAQNGSPEICKLFWSSKKGIWYHDVSVKFGGTGTDFMGWHGFAPICVRVKNNHSSEGRHNLSVAQTNNFREQRKKSWIPL